MHKPKHVANDGYCPYISMHESYEIEALMGRYLLEDEGTNCRILLKWILREKSWWAWNV